MEQVRACVIELQDHERNLDPRMPSGNEIADAYVTGLIRNCLDEAGCLLVYEYRGRVAGFVCVRFRVRSDDIDDGDLVYGLVTDLAVNRTHRGQGIGRALLDAGIKEARQHNVQWLRLSVMKSNESAHNLYRDMGFRDLHIDMELDLSGQQNSSEPATKG